METLECRRLLAGVELIGVPDWIEHGPGPIIDSPNVDFDNDETVSGAIEVVLPHPTNSNRVFVGTVNGGIWRTDDAYDEHVSWDPLTDQFSSLSISALAFSPLDPTFNTLYAGIGRFSSKSFNGSFDGGPLDGVLRSTDGGNSWSQLARNQFNLNNNGIDDDCVRGVDDGNEWLAVRSIQPTRMSTDGTINTQVVLAAALRFGAPPAPTPPASLVPGEFYSYMGGVFRSTDGGRTWTDLASTPGSGLPRGPASHLVADPANSFRAPNQGRFYAAFAATSGTSTLAAVCAGVTAVPAAPATVWRTDDSGLTWTNVTPAGIATANRIEIAVGNVGFSSGNRVYVAAITNGVMSGLWSSITQGSPLPGFPAWQTLPLPGDGDGGIHPGSQGGRHFSIVVDPGDVDTIFVGGDRSPNAPFGGRIFRGRFGLGGSSWQLAVEDGADAGVLEGDTFPHADSRDMAFNSRGDLLEVDDGGIARLVTPNNADTRYWESMNGILRITEFVGVAWDSNHNTIAGGTQDNGTAAQDEEGFLEWESLLGGDGNSVQIEQRSDSLGTYSAYFYSSQNLGNFQKIRVRDGAPDTSADIDLKLANGTHVSRVETIPFYTSYVLNNVVGGRMLLGLDINMYESFDDGDTLTPILQSGTPAAGMTPAQPNPVVAMTYGGRQNGQAFPDVIWAAVGGTLSFRQNQSTPFVNQNYPGGGIIRDLVIDPDNFNTIYTLASNGQVWRRRDGIWSNLTLDLPTLSTDLRTIELWLGGAGVLNDEIVMVGGRGGVYRLLENGDPALTEQGRQWTKLGGNLPNALVTDLRFDFSDDLLLVGTQGRGAFTMENLSTKLATAGILRIEGDKDQPNQDDNIILTTSAANPLLLDVVVNGVFVKNVPISTLSEIQVRGMGGNDSLTIDLTNGNFLPQPRMVGPGLIGVGLTYDGGPQTGGAGDRLTIIGGMNITGAYTPSGNQPGAGRVGINNSANGIISFTGLEPVNIVGFGTVTLITPNANDAITIDTPQPGLGRVSGTSGGVAFENLGFTNVGTVRLDLAANDGAGGNDVVTVNRDAVLASTGTEVDITFGPDTTGDILNYDAQGQDVTIDRQTISVPGGRPSVIRELERINLINAARVIVNGASIDNQLVVNASGTAAGTLRLDLGPVVTFSGITGLTFNGEAGSDRLTINNPAGTIFAPSQGIVYSAGAGSSDSLTLSGGGSAAFSQVHSVGPASPDGIINFTGPVPGTLAYSGVVLVTDTVNVGTYTVRATDAANLARLDNGPSSADGRLRLKIDSFSTIDFAAKARLVLETGLSTDDQGDAVVVNYTEGGTGLVALTINGGTGNDGIHIQGSVLGIGTTVHGGDGNDLVLVRDSLALSVNVTGDAGDDSIIAGAGSDVLNGGGGDDTVSGAGGNDQLIGGIGNDLLDGGDGVDTILGDAGDDVLLAGKGVGDSLSGGADNDRIIGSDEGADNDPNFTDAILFGDTIDGGTGNDSVDGLGGADNILGGDGDDVINSGGGGDFVRGGAGDDWAFAGIGPGDSMLGEAGSDTLYGSDSGADTIGGGDDNDQLFGQGLGDTITGDGGDDSIDGGDGADFLSGNAGNDELLGGGGTGDRLDGGDGDDVLRGSDDGADSITGGAGRDRAIGNAGNDTLAGGADADTLDGGAGDDSIFGEGGGDLLIGGANHDVIYGHSVSGAGDDTAVDYIYGDFGTGSDEAGSGRDQIFGQAGNDLMYGEGDDDKITAGAGTSDLINFGSGEGAVPGDFNAPSPTPPPQIVIHPAFNLAGPSLPVGVGDRGRWGEFNGSATNGGLSASSAMGIESVLASDASGNPFVAWVDSRSGNHEIYVARYTPAGWQQLAGSASGGGISATTGSSRQPSIVIGTDGNPIIAWTEFAGGVSNIRVAQFNGAAWEALGTSLLAGGISGTGAADSPLLVNTSAGPAVAWLDRSSGANNVYVRRFSAGAWSPLGGSAFASGSGVSGSITGVSELAAATDGVKLSVAWTQEVGSGTQIYLREFDGANWNALAGSNTGTGVSASVGSARSASIAYRANRPFVAWQDTGSGFSEIYASFFDGAAWQAAGTGARSGGGISQGIGYASRPRIAGNGDALHLVWVQDALQTRSGAQGAIYAKRWNGSAFVADATSDILTDGIAASDGIGSVGLSVGVTGKPLITWVDHAAGAPQAYVRGNNLITSRTFSAADGVSVQSILDANDLQSGDVIVVSGSSAGFTVGPNDSGLTIVGLPQSSITGPVLVSGADDVNFQDLTFNGTVTANGGARLSVRQSFLNGGLVLNATSDSHISHNSIAGIQLTGAVSGVAVVFNVLNGSTGLSIAAAASGTISQNTVAASTAGLAINAPFTGVIERNDIRGATTGVIYGASASLDANRIHGNSTGVLVTVTGAVAGFGFVGNGAPNEIFSNQTGVRLTAGQMQNQYVHDNSIGITGSGTLGGTSLDLSNRIERNVTGIDGFTGLIQYNRIAFNTVGIRASSNQLIAHNIIHRNAQDGLLVNGKSDVRIINNTFDSTEGDNIHLLGGSSDVQILNNILWASGGYDINVDPDSRTGFYSDYNTLYATGSGQIVRWLKDFNDILDWQQDVNVADLHSIGRTAVNPTWAEPRFMNRAWGDHRIFDLPAVQRFSSPTVDTAAPAIDLGLPASYQNLLGNPSFESGLSPWVVNVGGGVRSGSPTAFDGTNYFFPGSTIGGSAEQTVNLIAADFTPAQLDSGTLAAVFGGRIRSANEARPDHGELRLTFVDGAGNAIGNALLIPASDTTDRWELVGGRQRLPAGTRSIRYRFEAARQTGTTDDSVLDNAFLYVRPDAAGADQGALGNTPDDSAQRQAPRIHLISPDLYVDWELQKPHAIQWRTFNNPSASKVRVDVYRDTAGGPEFFLNLAVAEDDDGQFTWIPQPNQVAAGTTGLRIQVSLVTDNIVLDRSSEAFSIPETADLFYVDDGSNTNDEYTPSAVGSNRNTGKNPAAPKPLLTSVLRIYDLNPGDIVNVDTGNYDHFRTATISGNPLFGDDEGLTITGPADVARIAQLNTLGFTAPAVIDVNSGDFVILSHLTLSGGDYGLWARNASTNLTASSITAQNSGLDGVRLEADSASSILDRITARNNGRDGVSAAGPITRIASSLAHNNVAAGFLLGNSGATAVENNEAYANRDGLVVSNTFGNPTTVVGNADLSLSRGNRIHDNRDRGIAAQGSIVVIGNTVFGQAATTASIGIHLTGGASASHNIVYDNRDGIRSDSGNVTFNRVYHNANIGIQADNDADILANTVYSNAIGIQTTHVFTGANVRNNVVYANSIDGIKVFGGRNARIENNTLYQLAGDAIEFLPFGGQQTSNNRVSNNIIWVDGATGINLSPETAIAFKSDYNLFHAVGGGSVGNWEGVARPTLASWRLVSFLDANSSSADPRLVDIDGADNQLGFVGAVDRGTDDDFHEQSTAGSFHGGSLSPVLSATTGLPIARPGTLTPDPLRSPALDRGDPTSAFVNELLPNGPFINLGAYGNTVQASISPASYVTVLTPEGGEIVLAGKTLPIRWRSNDTVGTVKIELLRGGTPVLTISAAAPNSGSFDWAVPTSLASAADYFMRVTRNDAPAAADSNDTPFSIRPAVGIYYVNDGSFSAGDFTTAAGNDANDGLSPSTPKPSIRSILAAYDVNAGDVIRVDVGTYALDNNIVITGDDSGVRIEGFHDPANASRVAILNRNNTAAGSYVFELQNADDIVLDHLTISGATIGVFAADGSDSDRLTLSNSDLRDYSTYGVQVEPSNNDWTITANRLHREGSVSFVNGIVTRNVKITVSNNQIYGHITRGIIISNGSGSLITGNAVYDNFEGINADNSTISGNIVHDNKGVGINASTGTTISGNTVFNHTGGGSIGILAQGSSISVTDNISHSNVRGIQVNGIIPVLNNRVYNNSAAGLELVGAIARGNVVYSNGWGISAQGGELVNNLVYANAIGGISLITYQAQVLSNTIFQPTGDALSLVGGHNTSNTRVRNNILAVQAGHALRASPEAQLTFTSDYNLFFISGSGKVGFWGNMSRTTLADWRSASALDAASLVADPLFVDLDGGDNQLGFTAGADRGTDDDFHEKSLTGSFHGGSLAPIIDATTGLPVALSPTLASDDAQSPAIDRGAPTDPFVNETAPNGGFVNIGAFGNTAQASRSPAQYMLVVSPNGGESWAAKQTFTIAWRNNTIPSDTVKLDLLHRNGAGNLTLESLIDAAAPNTGQFVWAIPENTPTAGDYVLRVTANAAPGLSDLSDSAFSIAAATSVYYVNDGAFLPGDWTTAPGSDANDGRSPAAPKATIADLLASNDLEPGDVIRVDTGNYLLAGNIVISAQDAGVKIEGYHDAANPERAAVLNRGNTNFLNYAIVVGADDVTLDHLSITGAYYGITLVETGDPDRLTISNSDIYGNSWAGIYLFDNGLSTDGVVLTGNRIHHNYQGFSLLYGRDFLATNNQFYNNAIRGLSIQSFGAQISGNEFFNNGGNAVELVARTDELASRVFFSNNIVRDNASGVRTVNGNIVVENNEIYGHVQRSNAGLILTGGIARNNTIHDNYEGAQVTGGVVENNLVYHNATTGIRTLATVTISGNRIYGNTIGIEGLGRFDTPTYSGNLIYANAAAGIVVRDGYGYKITNNTVYQPTGTAVQIDAGRSHTLRNNILVSGGDYVLAVGNEAALDFSSDYNNLYATTGAKVARWAGHDFPTRADWTFGLGFDAHSQSIDPDFADFDGPDDLLGYRDTSGLIALYFDNENLAGQPVLRRTDRQVDFSWGGSAPHPVLPADHFSARWQGYLFVPQAGAYSLFTLVDDGERLFLDDALVIDQWTVDSAAENRYNATLTAGWHSLRFEMREGTSNATASLRWQGPGIGFQVIPASNLSTVAAPASAANFGADDDFSLQPSSLSIDAGDPISVYVAEPEPNGGRVNLGHHGNTPNAGVSPSQYVQLLSPNGLEKLEVGQPRTINWQSAGLSQNRPIALIDVGALTARDWSLDTYRTSAASSNFFRTYPNAINTSGVVNPAPPSVYQSIGYGNSFGDNQLNYAIPVPNGQYTVRLHFIESELGAPGRRFDIKLQGNTVRAAYDIFADAGARFKATALSFPVAVTSSGGISLDLLPVNGTPILAGIEISAINPQGAANATADLQLSTDNGANWSTIAQNAPMDMYGRGSHAWTPSSELDTSAARIRVIVNVPGSPSDLSDQPFTITNGDRHFYVNDSSTAGDMFSAAPGDNANSGKSPAKPMASVESVLLAYDLEPGDVIHVDAGTYNLYRNIVLSAEDSGVRIEGPSIPGSGPVALFNRNNIADGNYIFQLSGADDIALDHLSVTGGASLIYAPFGGDSDRIAITNSEFFGAPDNAIHVGSGNDDWIITNNSIHHASTTAGFSRRGIFVSSSRVTITGNLIFSNPGNGIVVENGMPGTTISRNRVHQNATGIFANSNSNSVAVTISDNEVFANTTGLHTGNGVASLRNQIHANVTGMILDGLSGSPVAEGNRVYNNTGVGILARLTNVVNNHVYSNAVGIKTDTGFTGRITGNLVYGNTNQGIFINGATGARVTNNTVYQIAGDALRLENSANVGVYSNLLWIDAGHDIYVAPTAQAGFASDYNLLYTGSAGQGRTGFWNNTAQATLAAWQAASSQDAHSTSADPQVIDVDGADDVLGFRTGGLGFDGGLDDNFILRPASPAIDRGHSFIGTGADILGFARADDPGTTNNGSPDYSPMDKGSSLFAATGASLNLRTTGSYVFNYLLPFSFPFYGTAYTRITVFSDGFLQLAGNDFPTDGVNSLDAFLRNVRIAPLWDNIRTNGPGNDVFADTSVANQITFRWNATNEADNSPVNFSATLFSDGRIRFDYGNGNQNLTPTVGISAGDGTHFNLAPYNNASTLTNSNSIEYVFVPGIVDIGSYEFGGSTTDTTAPTIPFTNPSAIHSSGATNNIARFDIQFSEPLNPVAARTANNYELRSAGPDNIFDNADDVLVNVVPSYAAGSTTVTLTVLEKFLLAGSYRLTAFGSPGRGLTDLSGLRIDGNGDNLPGGNYSRSFTLASSMLLGDAAAESLILRRNVAGTALEVFRNSPVTGAPTDVYPLTALASLVLATGAGADTVTLDLSNGDFLPATGLTLDAGPGGGDLLHIIGTSTQNLTYTPSATTPNSGQIQVNGKLIQFVGTQSITSRNLADFTFITPSSADTILLDTLSPDERRFSGTSGGTSFSPFSVFNASRIILDAAANDVSGSGDDSITIRTTASAAPIPLEIRASSGNNLINLESGNILLTSDVEPGSLTLNASGSAQLQLSSDQHFKSLSLANTSRLAFLAGGGKVLRLDQFFMSPTAVLDLDNNAMVVHNGNLDAIRALLIAGRGSAGGVVNGKWNGTSGITSTAARLADVNTERRVLGYALNKDLLVKYQNFAGVPVGENDVLIRFTKNADANLDGVANNNDITILAGFYRPGQVGKHWHQADFNYDGKVDNNDITTLAGFYAPGEQLTSPAPSEGFADDSIPLWAHQEDEVLMAAAKPQRQGGERVRSVFASETSVLD